MAMDRRRMQFMPRAARPLIATALALGTLHVASPAAHAQQLDLLILGGRVVDGTGNPWQRADVGVSGDRIAFVGIAATAGVHARDTLDAAGAWVAPGFWDVHSHAALTTDHGRRALPKLYQGITTVVVGVDGNGSSAVAEYFERLRVDGTAVNAVRFVGHGAARSAVMGVADRPPTPDELQRMKEYVRRGMDEGAAGLSTGLFYSPGFFADTDEVVELARVAASFDGVYDTHDRDLGAAYRSVGYHASVREGIEIGERAGLPVIFSHFNLQGTHLYGRADEGARLIDEARARGVDVVAGHHMYMATASGLSAYAMPRWAVVGGAAAMRARFADPETRRRIAQESEEMLVVRGGAGKIVFTDRDPELNGRTLAAVAHGWGVSVPDAVMRILEQGGASVMNMDLYDMENTRHLARQEWMMTCTDGGTPADLTSISHPRSYGSFARKLRQFVVEEALISLPFAIRGMTSLAANFYGYRQRGQIREGFFADIAVFELENVRDVATYEQPHQYAAGMRHVLVNGRIAFRAGAPTDKLAARPLPRERGAATRVPAP
jgi:N-acyl-D-amino-acid deacylase